MRFKKQLRILALLSIVFTLAFTSAVTSANTSGTKASKNAGYSIPQIQFPTGSLKDAELLNVSYDPTREFYDEYNKVFAKFWKSKTGQDIKFRQSHGGSGRQARSIVDGLEADVATLALAYDIHELAKKSLIPNNWQERLPHNSSPYTSTIVFIVRKGNPKNIKDWDDLVRPDVKVITPNPKTSGGARWNYLAAWAYAEKKFNKDEAKVRDFITKLYKNVPVLDTGARASTTTFVQRRIGDVFISWENEAFLVRKEFGKNYQVIYPSLSILAEPPVTVVDKNVDKKGNRAIATAYLQYLYSEEAQRIIAGYGYRPLSPSVQKQFRRTFPKLNLVSIKDFDGWEKAQSIHFNDGGTFDKIYTLK